MPGFHWEAVHNLALAKEVATHRPQKPLDWAEIAERLNTAFSTDEKHVLKGRECKDRLDFLLKTYKEEDAKSLKKYACTFIIYAHYLYHRYLTHVCTALYVCTYMSSYMCELVLCTPCTSRMSLPTLLLCNVHHYGSLYRCVCVGEWVGGCVGRCVCKH